MPRWTSLFSGLLAVLFTSGPVYPAPSGSILPDSLRLWQEFLTQFVDTSGADGINRIRFASVTPEEKDSLEIFIRSQESMPVSAFAREDQKAYWINLYNATVIAVVLRNYPLKSIMDINLGPSPQGKGPFRAKLLWIEGDSLSLDDIEHEILRPRWQDPRIHFALNCASIGCPNLSAEPFTAANIRRLMKKSACDFLRTERGAVFRGDTLVLSSIFEWYPEDFGSKNAVVLGILANYADPKLKDRFRSYAGKIKYQYDWSLNEAKP